MTRFELVTRVLSTLTLPCFVTQDVTWTKTWVYTTTVPEEGLEPSSLSAPASKTGVYAVPPFWRWKKIQFIAGIVQIYAVTTGRLGFSNPNTNWLRDSFPNRLVSSEGVEPSRSFEHMHLKHVRLPLRHDDIENVILGLEPISPRNRDPSHARVERASYYSVEA